MPSAYSASLSLCFLFVVCNIYIYFFSSFEDPGPHGNGRYSEHMLPEIEKKDFRKGAQVFITVMSPKELKVPFN